MTQGPYYYETQVSWNEKRRGAIAVDRLPPISVSSPPEFEGEAGFWSPEHLLVASAESCLMMTFLAIAEKARLPILSYQSWALGKLDLVQGQGLRFTKLTIRPAIKLEHSEDLERGSRVVEKAEKHCFVAKALNVPIQIEPRFLLEDEQPFPPSRRQVA